jgi:hypothetical protein
MTPLPGCWVVSEIYFKSQHCGFNADFRHYRLLLGEPTYLVSSIDVEVHERTAARLWPRSSRQMAGGYHW